MYSSEQTYPLSDETFKIIGLAMEIHRILGRGFSEVVYKDAMEYELSHRGIDFEREKEFVVKYKNVFLPHKFYADFLVFNSVIVEIKAQKGIVEDHYGQTINYLAASKCQIGLILNFGEPSLVSKRVIL